MSVSEIFKIVRIALSMSLLGALLTWSIGCIDDEGFVDDGLSVIITGIIPDEGIPSDTILITGEQFEAIGTDSVFVNGTLAIVISLTDTEVRFIVPDTATSGPVSVRNTLGLTIGPDLIVLEDILPPMVSIDSIRPEAVFRGDSISVHGQNFNLLPTDFQVLLGDQQLRSSLASNLLIHSLTPTDAATGRISLVNGNDTIEGPILSIFDDPSIAIISVEPERGQIGAQVAVTGQNFDQLPTDFQLFFGDVPASASIISAQEIQTAVPQGATSGDVTIDNEGEVIGGPFFIVDFQPVINAIDPISGEIGTSVTISGEDFGTDATDLQVAFNQVLAEVTSVSNTEIITSVPLGAITGPVTVGKIGSGLSATGPIFTVTTTNPEITGISPESGEVGTLVTIQGQNFGADAAEVEVTFNGEIATVNAIADTEIQAFVPSNATTGIVSVRSLLTGFSGDGPVFTVTEIIPEVTSVLPTSGPVGTVVIIQGQNFGTEATEVEVTFNGETASINSISDTEIEVVVPANASTGIVAVRSLVTGNRGDGPVFTVTVITPEITNISPAVGPVGTEVTITGQNFGTVIGNLEVDFNGEIATVNSLTDTQIIAEVPANAATGPVSVTRLDNGQAVTGPVFTVDNNCPVITNISPTSGPAGTQVTISGDNFGLTFVDVEVRLNGLLIDPGFIDITEIRFTVPLAATTGIVSVTTTSNGKTSNGPVFTVEVPDVTVSSIAGPNDGVTRPLQIIGDGNGNFLFSDTQSHQIKRVDPNGNVTVFAGTGTPGIADGDVSQAQFNQPGGLTRDAQGNIYVADVDNHVIRLINTSGVVSTIAGIGQAGFADGIALSEAQFDQPIDVAILGSDLFISDLSNHAIRKLDIQSGQVTTVAGNGTAGLEDGFRSASQLNSPIGISIDNYGDLIIADALNHAIRRLITASNFLLTEVGLQGRGFTDGSSSFAQFDIPYDVQIDSQGAIYVADGNNHSIRKIGDSRITSTIAGTGVSGLLDGGGNQAQFNFPTGIYIASDTELWICDFNNDFIRKIDITP